MSDTSSKNTKRLKFTNEKIVIRNSKTPIDSRTIEINQAQTNVSNVKIDTPAINSKVAREQEDIGDLTFRNEYSSRTTTPNTKNSSDNYILPPKELNNIGNKLHSNPPQNFNPIYNNKPPENTEHYYEKDIDWNSWKSNFINKILDDSVYIKALDEYGLGAWFFYSFNVNSDGTINNVKVMSLYLAPEDKEKVIQLIKSYAHKPITRFPLHSKRQTVKVSAAVLLGKEEKRSTPKDFNENEHVRIKY